MGVLSPLVHTGCCSPHGRAETESLRCSSCILGMKVTVHWQYTSKPYRVIRLGRLYFSSPFLETFLNILACTLFSFGYFFSMARPQNIFFVCLFCLFTWVRKCSCAILYPCHSHWRIERDTVQTVQSRTCDKTKRLVSQGAAPQEESQGHYRSVIPRIMCAFYNYATELSLCIN